jgi:hypothetical protein
MKKKHISKLLLKKSTVTNLSTRLQMKLNGGTDATVTIAITKSIEIASRIGSCMPDTHCDSCFSCGGEDCFTVIDPTCPMAIIQC